MNDPTFEVHDFDKYGNMDHKVMAKFTLRRIPSGLVLTFYVPSLFIIAMTIVPLYLKDDLHFATTITLVLTAMLCLYTLLQSSVSDVPKTAYLKNIDYWNILSLVITVINFFILIVWQMCHDSKKPENIGRQIKSAMRVIMPILSFIAVGVYIVRAATIYNEYSV